MLRCQTGPSGYIVLCPPLGASGGEPMNRGESFARTDPGPYGELPRFTKSPATSNTPLEPLTSSLLTCGMIQPQRPQGVSVLPI